MYYSVAKSNYWIVSDSWIYLQKKNSIKQELPIAKKQKKNSVEQELLIAKKPDPLNIWVAKSMKNKLLKISLRLIL
jgi:hypothetical protein